MSEPVVTLPVRTVRRIVAFAAVMLLIGALAYVSADLLRRPGGILSGSIAGQIDPGRFQSIVLSGGQVFFGRLTAKGDVYLLADVFYLTPAAEGSAEPGTLVKRGSELHGPAEPLVIPKEQVVFMENLKADSQVVQAIERFRSGQTAPPVTPRAAPQTVRPSPSPTR